MGQIEQAVCKQMTDMAILETMQLPAKKLRLVLECCLQNVFTNHIYI